MGVVDFDPDKWSQANQAEPEPRAVAKVANPAKVEGPEGELSQLSQLSQLAPVGLPADLRNGLTLLREMTTPRIARPELWPGVVADALALASDGWIGKALALGWTALDLFGAVFDPAGDPDADGLAVKLCGRRVLALCSGFATVEDRNSGRFYLYRGNNEGAQLLWELGRKQERKHA